MFPIPKIINGQENLITIVRGVAEMAKVDGWGENFMHYPINENSIVKSCALQMLKGDRSWFIKYVQSKPASNYKLLENTFTWSGDSAKILEPEEEIK